MSLNDPFFTRFDGSPDLGRVPVRLVVNGSGLTSSQLRGVEHAYNNFRSAYRLSVVDFHTEQIKLNDGTIVHMWSLQGRDEVTVWTSEEGGGTELPHGFAVATNWQGPMIYCRDLNDGVHWLIGPPAPQIASHTTTNYDNQVFRLDAESAEFFNLPHVRDHTNSLLWDYSESGVPSVAPEPVIPFLLKNTTTGAFLFESPHYASGGKLIDAGGATLYTMADEAPILVPEHPDYPESVHQHPGVTDASGNKIALQAMRFTVISPSSNIWRFKLWNERINRTADSAYSLVERAAIDLTTPWGKQTTTTVSVNDSSLGESPEALFKFKGTFDRVSGALNGYSGSGGYVRLYHTGWAGPNNWIDITAVPLGGNDEQSLRQIKEQASGTATYDKMIAAGSASDIGYIQIERKLNYPATVYWRGGHHKKWYYPENLNTLWGRPVDTSFGAHYRSYDIDLFRYDTRYDVDGLPKITAKLGWRDLLLLDGSTTSRMSGKEHTNVIGQVGTYLYIDNDWPYARILKEVAEVNDFYDPDLMTPIPGWTAWLDANDDRSEYWADYMAYGTEPGYTQTTAPQPGFKYEYPFNDRPANTAEYSLTSRYVIDYDHKGRFYAAIRCEVICTGAEWEENIGVYKGYMQVKTNPSYTARIWFECEWNGVFAQQLLVEEAVTRPMFEAVTISQFNPWYWHLPAYVDRDCKVRTPPEPVPDEDFMMMFNNLASHQGANTRLCCADVRPDITGADIARSISNDGIEYSLEENGAVTPHARYVTGQLYARTFKLSDIDESLWMLKQLKVDAVEDDFQPIDGPVKPTWFYHPAIKAALEVNRHIEVRDGVIVQWSDNIPTEISGYPPASEAHPAPTSRIIKLYRV